MARTLFHLCTNSNYNLCEFLLTNKNPCPRKSLRFNKILSWAFSNRSSCQVCVCFLSQACLHFAQLSIAVVVVVVAAVVVDVDADVVVVVDVFVAVAVVVAAS